ncbi:ScbA/BarX family gamma-butyrolactone biosynthesis protein [Streptomyces sp. NPDC060223]|uniref:ScbA/BarX family gamma-butyrolactone biosynthesis protein n=1 Tax=unclassified Streptomyces TaxID=2593676 RepID=UPI00363AC90A
MPENNLNYSSTVPRNLVHRASVGEVFLTDHQPHQQGALIAAYLPRTHAYYSDHTISPAHYDPLLIMEVLRQCGILAAHAYVGAPEGASFVFDSASLAVLDMAALRIGPESARAVIDFQVVETKTRGGRVTGAVYEGLVRIDGRDAVSSRIECRWMPSRTWQALRERSRSGLDLTPRAHLTGLRLPTYLVGRRSAQNVVLADAVMSGNDVTGHIVVDQGHPGLFDHPLDHIPGALMFEAFRQTALYAASEVHGFAPRGLALESLQTTFALVGEFELPTDCRATVGAATNGGVDVDLVLAQEDRTVATAQLRWGRTLCPASPSQDAQLVSA